MKLPSLIVLSSLFLTSFVSSRSFLPRGRGISTSISTSSTTSISTSTSTSSTTSTISTLMMKNNELQAHHNQNHNHNHNTINLIRGGGRDRKSKNTLTNAPSDTAVAIKAAMSVILSTAGFIGVLALGNAKKVVNFFAAIKLPAKIAGLPPSLYLSFYTLTFASTFITSIVNGGFSAATKQTLRPNETPNPAWYQGLNKPSWNPPGWLFPIMWLIISKPTQILALRQIFLKSGAAGGGVALGRAEWAALSLYCSHLALGDTWNDVFFGFQRIKLGLKVILTFYATLLGSTSLFFKISPKAGYFMLPTCGWVTVASFLNFSIFRLNKDKP